MTEFLDLSNYTKSDFLGGGSYGLVYKAIDNRARKVYAAKIMNYMITDQTKEQNIDLKREINILSRLKHPSVIEFIGYNPINFAKENFPVIVTEYCQNGTLNDFVHQEYPMPCYPFGMIPKK